MRIISLVFFLALSSCSSKFLKYEKQDKFFKNEEFEREVKIQEVDDKGEAPVKVEVKSEPAKVEEKPQAASTETKKVAVKKEPKKAKTKKADAKKAEAAISTKRQPEIEDNEGFTGISRRPNVDPFKVGEKVIHEVSYFSAKAGTLTMQVKPFAQVNNRKSYNFVVDLQSSRVFSNFYSVEDTVNTFLDYENLIPHVLKINIKETGKLVQSQAYFNNENLTASFWEKKYTEKSGEEERKFTWDILPFSQNAFSGLFYMRVFNWKEGKQVSFRVAEDQKNIVFTGTAIGKEKLSTEAGEFNAIKIKASIVTRGALSQTGDIFLWISDDEHKYILRIEAKIKIGTLVSEVTEIDPGH
ncbi:hypothetical protein CIK05_10445 [Bdellovibrio sp. qaytius]|nr:hypothetical protein CIK05_10445 [Bdellovibrio sp. qaytius]